MRKRISLLLSEQELKTIKRAADRAHLPYTTWMRQVALLAAEKHCGPEE